MAQLTIQQTFDLAMQHHQAGRLQEAEQLYRQILAQDPNHAQTLHSLGMLAGQCGRADLAVELIGRAITLVPELPHAHNNLGISLRQTGQLAQAIAAYRRAIALAPRHAEAHNNLGIALGDVGHVDEAIAAFRQAITLAPDYADAYFNLGVASQEKGQLDQAVAAYGKAIALRPDLPDAYNNLANAMKEKGELDGAIVAYRQAIAVSPHYADAHCNLGNALKETGQLDEAIAQYRRAIALNSNFVAAGSNLLYSLYFHPAYNLKAIAEEHRLWNSRHGEPLRKSILVHSNDRSFGRRLRVGYLSPDFREHVVGRSLLPLLLHHDRLQFEIICYAQVSNPDAITRQFQQNADTWRNIRRQSDEQVAEQIRQDKVDILVDLTMHMANNRLLVFARKPAPVQVTYLAYCGSTGLTAMDYRLSDPYMDPPDTDLSWYTEKTLRLPRSYWCYQPGSGNTPDSAPPPALSAGFVTFGCLNNFAKVSSAALDLWARILMESPKSRLIVHAPAGRHLDGVVRRMQAAGVTDDRLKFPGKQSWAGYIQTYSQIDVALDPFPYGGGITTCDALWMGVPVVSLSGQTPVGRGGRSILSNLGLAELIAYTPDQYVHIAIELARDQDRMESLRRGMRDLMLASPLMDAKGFARDVEAHYRRMWQTWCKSVSAG